MTDRLDNMVKLVEDAAILKERARIVKLLLDREIIRDSMLGPGWIVAYSTKGPLDIRMSELLGPEAETNE